MYRLRPRGHVRRARILLRLLLLLELPHVCHCSHNCPLLLAARIERIAVGLAWRQRDRRDRPFLEPRLQRAPQLLPVDEAGRRRVNLAEHELHLLLGRLQSHAAQRLCELHP